MADTIDGIDLADIQSEAYVENAQLEIITYPLSDSEENSVIDYNGTRRIITIRGLKTGTTAKELWDFISDISAIIDGDQDTIIYHSDGWTNSTKGNHTDGNFNVKIANFNFQYVNDKTLSVVYTLVLYESETGV